MYSIEKHIYYRSDRLREILQGYFKHNNVSCNYLNDRYINNEKGDEFLKFLKKIKFTPAKYATNQEHLNDIRAILRFLSYKSKFLLKDWKSEEIRYWTLESANCVIWTELTDLRTLYSNLSQYLIAKAKENPRYFEGQYLLYYWIMFEVQFRLTKAEKEIWEQGLEEFMQYVYGKLAILAGS